MATDIYSMLTGGYDPRAEQMKQQQLFQQQLGQSTTPQSFIATVGSNMGNMLGQGVQKIAGVKDPREEKAIKKREALEKVKASGVDMKDQVAFLSAVAQEFQNVGLTAEALQASQAAQSAKVKSYQTKGFENEDKAREAVSKLLAQNPNATSQELYAVAAPFSANPEAMIKVVAGKEDKAAALQARQEAAAEKAEARLEEIKLRGQQRVEAAKAAGASREEVARIAAEGRAATSTMMGQMRMDIARMNIAARREAAALKRNTGVLAPSLQKEEGKDLENIDNFEAMSTVLNGAVNALTPNDKGVVAIRLNPAAKVAYEAANFFGNSTPESRAYSDLQASVAQAVNIKTDAARGVQTDKDVLRFANALVEISARNDVKATREALIKFQNAAKTAGEAAKVRINSRRQAQNVGAYFTDVATPEGTSPSGANQNRTTPIYATNGTQRIVSTDGGKTWKEVR